MASVCPDCRLPDHLTRQPDGRIVCGNCAWLGEDDDLYWEDED